MTDEYLEGITAKLPKVRTLLCIGGSRNGCFVTLVVSCNRVDMPVPPEPVEWYEDDEPTLPEIWVGHRDVAVVSYTVRKITFPDGNFVEVLGLAEWTDYTVFRYLTKPQED